MAQKRDFYEVLGVARGATDDEVRKAYRKLALESHPDRNPGDKAAEGRFKEATEAYEVLREPERRRRYDQVGHAAEEAGAGVDFSGFDIADALRTFMRDFGGFGNGGDFEEKFGGGRRGGPSRGQDLQVRLKLTLEEIATGAEKEIRLKRSQRCETCKGTGAAKGGRERCPDCGGQGQVRQVRSSLFGQFVSVTACPRCHGEGDVVRDPCLNCRGETVVPEVATVRVQVPAGVAEGQYLTLAGEGNAGRRGGPNGDLLVILHEKPHEVFVRRGDDLMIDLPVGISTLAIGGKVEVPTLDARVSMTVPAGTQPDRVLRVRERGLPRLNRRGKGDLLVRLKVYVPPRVSGRERELLEELARLQESKIPKPGKNFTEKVREAFGG